MAGESFGNGYDGGQDWGVLDSERLTQEPTPEASALGDGAEEFFEQRFPGISEAAREARVEHAIQAGLSRMDGMKDLERNFLASRGETLPEDYDERLLGSMKLEMSRVLANLYGDKSRLLDEVEGERLGPNEEIAWDMAMEPHKPGTLSLTDLFMNNPQHEGETAEDYKQRLYNYRKQDLARDKQLAEDAAYVEAHPETAKEHHELRGMRFNTDLKRQYPGAWEAMGESMREPEEETEDNGDEVKKVEAVEEVAQPEKENPLEGMSLRDLRDETKKRMETCENPDMQVRLAILLGRLNERLAQMAIVEVEAEVAEATA